MSDALQSEASFNVHNKTLFWPSNFNLLANTTDCLKTMRKTFDFDDVNKRLCLSIRSAAEQTFAEGVRKQITENVTLENCSKVLELGTNGGEEDSKEVDKEVEAES